MTAEPRPAGPLAAAVLAERFPTYRQTLNEAVRKPRPMPALAPAALVDDELACARRRRDLCDALNGVHLDFARTA